MVAPTEAFHLYVIEVPDTTAPFPGDSRVGAAGIVGDVGVGVGVGVGSTETPCTAL